MSKVFNKEEFKKSVVYNVKNLFRRTMDEATPAQVFQAVSYAVKDVIIDEWIASQKTYAKEDAKTVYYLSMEFLMGRALGNNIINIMAKDEIREVLEEMGFDLNVIEDSGKRRFGTTGCLFPGFPGNFGLSGLWLWNPVSLRNV